MAKKRSRVNSSNPSHRRTVRTQSHARRKGGNVSGKLKTGFYDSRGVWRANPKAVIVNGRKTYPAGLVVEVFNWEDELFDTTARIASGMISSGGIPNQELKPKRRR